MFKFKNNKYQGSSEYLKKALDLSKLINTRYYYLIVIILILMIVIIGRLYYVQIIKSKDYQSKLEAYASRYQTITTPRGEIIDRNGLSVVSNEQRLIITYFPSRTITDSKEWLLAYNFSKDFYVDDSVLKSRDLKDLFITTQSQAFKNFVKENQIEEFNYILTDEYQSINESLLSEEEHRFVLKGKLSNKDAYYLKLSRIDDHLLKQLTPELKKVWVVKQSMDMPSSGQTKIIKEDATFSETAFLMEHSEAYPGFDVQIDWQRVYPFQTSFKAVLGSVTNSKQGLPKEDLDYYLALGYSRNDKIGKSGIEKQYEELLNGSKAKYSLLYDENEQGYLKEVQQGSKGYDLQLAVDMQLQQYIEKKSTDILNEFKEDKNRAYFDRVNVVVLKPKTGEVLSMVSMVQMEDGSVVDDPVDTYTGAYIPGSIVKGATLYMGINEGVVKPGEVILDAPVKLKGTPTKSSWSNLGLINDLTALSRSSNIYMLHIAIRMSGGQYVFDGPLYVKDGIFQTFRNYYSLFGLGVLTGVDVPNEAIGYMGLAKEAGNALDYVIGQYDNYTTLMLAQYIGTIANNGIKMKPRLVTKAYEPKTREVIYENPATILNEVENKEALQRVQEGFYQCVNASNGLCYGYHPDLKQKIAAKTGTAQAYFTEEIDGQPTRIEAYNHSTITYAPYDDPEYAIACVMPNGYNGSQGQSNLCLRLTNEIYLYLFGLAEDTINQ